jgi:drug/metabolite transporter (DMT)-like permease
MDYLMLIGGSVLVVLSWVQFKRFAKVEDADTETRLMLLVWWCVALLGAMLAILAIDDLTGFLSLFAWFVA